MPFFLQIITAVNKIRLIETDLSFISRLVFKSYSVFLYQLLKVSKLSRDRCMYVLKNPFVEKQIAYLDVGKEKVRILGTLQRK